MIQYIFKNVCPKCHKAKIFQRSSIFSFKADMNKECPECHLDFTKEPGFYWGAMYVSYGLAVLEAFISYFICRIAGTESFDFINLWIMMGTILLLSPVNFRISRITWLYIFQNN